MATSAQMAKPHFLERLPEELLHDILNHLDKHTLSLLNLVSRWCYRAATPLIWRDLQLVDCSTMHGDGFDEHDDSPFLKKLLVLAK